MFSIMIIRHNPIYNSADHHLWYYPLPFLAVLAYGGLILLDALMPLLGRGQATVVNLLLLAMVVGNVASWHRHREVILHSQWFPRVFHQNAALKLSFREGKARDELRDEYKDFYRFLIRRR